MVQLNILLVKPLEFHMLFNRVFVLFVLSVLVVKEISDMLGIIPVGMILVVEVAPVLLNVAFV